MLPGEIYHGPGLRSFRQPVDGCPGSEALYSRRAPLPGPSPTAGAGSTRQIDAIFHRMMRAQHRNVFLLRVGTAENKTMMKLHKWVNWVWEGNVSDTGNKPRLRPTDIRKRKTLWPLEPPLSEKMAAMIQSTPSVESVGAALNPSSATLQVHCHIARQKCRVLCLAHQLFSANGLRFFRPHSLSMMDLCVIKAPCLPRFTLFWGIFKCMYHD